MGWFDGIAPSSTSSHKHESRRRSSSSRRSKYSSYNARHSAPSVFSLGSGVNRAGRSSPSVFSSSSSRRARPREGFVARIIHIIRRIFRDAWNYARDHPIKVLMLLVIPLLTTGVVQKLLGMIGIRLPKNLTGGSGARPGGFGFSDNITGLMNIAKMFM
ncbi:uncharacterized protein BP01DRAFT_235093 [Aspergillus saccharolyticus JOP 1030-1]|uniref:Uncharacterized protein n=1 Tax=Aspergillus saccharolyticus JOP 1030-1 TaxID=1450539 RepID=A0A318Z8T8_9EURO|nr:hypothetical protein BP01DRAFT_235093 [Aspergillus saccharolyticus JOP 1030-1]PYH40060.1 hypothetical protein BP01DRAFT_235093 [Aspergillus saccharolyticus JOP 1030-1]